MIFLHFCMIACLCLKSKDCSEVDCFEGKKRKTARLESVLFGVDWETGFSAKWSCFPGYVRSFKNGYLTSLCPLSNVIKTGSADSPSSLLELTSFLSLGRTPLCHPHSAARWKGGQIDSRYLKSILLIIAFCPRWNMRGMREALYLRLCKRYYGSRAACLLWNFEMRIALRPLSFL